MDTIDYTQVKAWPFQQAKKLIQHLERKGKTEGDVIFETGYGASGLPHIGTFCEVFRPLMVLQAFKRLQPHRSVKLIMFSDDMDGFRKVPTNLPQQEMLAQHLNKPLTDVPDPFGECESLAHYNNAKLREFLDTFDFEYEFKSATEEYRSGALNEAILKVLEHHEEVCEIVRPTLGEERRKTYSPFLPVCPETGHVLQVPVIATNVEKGTITYQREDGEQVETEVTNGRCKMQWKADWAMRWCALDVDYEMAGKDLIDSVNIGGRINRAIGGTPPLSFIFEHFVDENGAKISKSKGNGLTIDEWLKYGNPESLGLFMYHRPERAKKLFLDVVPKMVDEYLDHLSKYLQEEPQKQVENPVWHVHNGNPPKEASPISYNMLLNLLGAAAEEATPELLWGFITQYKSEVTPQTHPKLNNLIVNATNYYKDHILPTKEYRTPVGEEVKALQSVVDMLEALTGEETAEDIQTHFYTLGKQYYGKERLKDWFAMLYQTLFGTSQGPRLGSFVKIYGIANTVQMVERAVARPKNAA
ncbi:MAG: lysine--tRNA ligase [Alphaproteobacteria bacterium]|nr:lysine--tRNA ligase [Alphaproteobacteria bacterium]MDD9920059.1 lysine--tRNA ligase [Alphaproteobacteria bacterium]